MKKLFFILICLSLLISTSGRAQRPTAAPNVFIYVEENLYPMQSITSQTEKKKGWDIQGFSVGGKFQRYFWGKKSKQLTDSRPHFAIYPKEYKLNDYALIRLNERKTYRRLPDAELKECDYVRIDLNSFIIENLPDMGFSVTPKDPLFPGEYILINLEQTPVNEQGDIIAYDFTVSEK